VKVVTATPELLAESDETIDEAVRHADPMVLRGLVYQLTGDESLAVIRPSSAAGGAGTIRADVIQAISDDRDLEIVRSKAAAFLKSYRDAGAGEISIGPLDRLPRSLSLTAGADIPPAELEMWLELFALDPYARGLEWSEEPPVERLEGFSVIVIGSGMAGLGAAVQLSHAGIPFTVLEKNSSVGGTWYENRYPGCRVDTPSRVYSHVFGVDFVYPGAYCEQSENEKYVNWVADHFDVRKNIVFDTEVKSIVWDDDAKVWEITSDDPDGPRIWRANAVITGVGLLSRPNVPDIPGLDTFDGEWFHTARWPSDFDPRGKRIAVVGSGCTGYQLVPELIKEAGHIVLFQRSPSWVFDVPGYLTEFPPQRIWLEKNFPYLTNFARFAVSWLRRPGVMKAATEVDPNFDDPIAISPANKQVVEQRLAFMASKFGDRTDLIEKMTPSSPPYASRPVAVDREYSIFDVLLQDDVTLVTEGIREIDEHALVLQDGSTCPVDAIAFATGFKANDFLFPMEIRGRDGVTTQELWAKDGGRAYLGGMLPGFPNFFMLYGPNTNSNYGFQSIHTQELVLRFALECLAGVILQNKKTVEVTSDAYWRFNDELDRAAAVKVFSDPRNQSYYRNQFGRSATNGSIDPRVFWRWLRDPSGPLLAGEGHRLDEPLERTSDAISPYFGQDLVLE
jgi:4-hydroxyacetophenone monooxygenase